jgi:hypothetical protein
VKYFISRNSLELLLLIAFFNYWAVGCFILDDVEEVLY